jgi:acyl-coenzyme A thioesterase PaaI-like protein
VEPHPTRHVIRDLGLAVRRVGDEVHGRAIVSPEMSVPGTGVLRTSILATWADTLTGMLTIGHVQPRVPVTLQLDVDLHRPPAGLEEVHLEGRMVKAGEATVVSVVDLLDERGDRFGGGVGLFMVARDPSLRLPSDLDGILAQMDEARSSLTVPFAERAGCVQEARGTVSLGLSPEHTNASHTLNGGLLALIVEDAALSAGSGGTLAAMTLRYLRGVRVGPGVATATVRGDVADVEVTDRGRDDVLCVLATTRSFPTDASIDAAGALAGAVEPGPGAGGGR